MQSIRNLYQAERIGGITFFSGMYRIIGLLFLVFFIRASDDPPRIKLRMQGGIPKNITSRLFIYSFNGEAAGQVQFSFYLFDRFYAGLGYFYAQFVNSKDFRDPLNINLAVRLHSHGFSIRIAYDLPASSRFRCVFALPFGYSHNLYSNRSFSEKDTLIPSPVFNSPMIQPEISIEYLIEKNFCFSAALGYQYQFEKFNPRQSSLDRFYNNAQLKKYNSNSFGMSWINFSFGCTIYFGKVRN